MYDSWKSALEECMASVMDVQPSTYQACMIK